MILHDPNDFVADYNAESGKQCLRPAISSALELANLPAPSYTPSDTDHLVTTLPTPASLPQKTFRLKRYRGCAFGFLFAIFIGGLVREIQHILREVERRNIRVMSPDTPEPCVSYAAWNLNPTFGNQHHFLHSASTSFQLPLDSDLLYFIGTGAESQLEGSVDISNSPDIDAHHVKVEISAFYDMVDILEWTRVCLLQRSEKKHGVGIFTAVPWPHKPKGYQAFFEVKIRLPPRGNSPLRINHMETDLPYFSHDVGDIGDTVFFNTVSIASKSAPIFVHSLSAERASISTYDAWVVGSFESSSSLKIEGHGSTITANVTLLNDDSGVPTELYLQDGSESIEARINLTSTSDTRTGGSFKVDARTSGSKPINITFPYAPIDSKIHVDARTWGAPVEVRAHETFEGTWSTRSSPDADLVTDMITMRPDPSGRERVRNGLDWGVTAGVREGNIYWGHPDDSKKYGEIRLQTFNAPAQLFL